MPLHCCREFHRIELRKHQKSRSSKYFPLMSVSALTSLGTFSGASSSSCKLIQTQQMPLASWFQCSHLLACCKKMLVCSALKSIVLHGVFFLPPSWNPAYKAAHLHTAKAVTSYWFFTIPLKLSSASSTPISTIKRAGDNGQTHLNPCRCSKLVNSPLSVFSGILENM